MDEYNNDPMLPEGWSEGDDIFGGQSALEAAFDGGKDPAPTPEPEPPAPEPPATEDPAAEDPAPTDPPAPTPEPDEQPDEAPTPEPKRLKFTAKVDREEQEVDLDEADLPTIWQKAQVTDRVQAKLDALNKKAPIADKAEGLARMLGYEDTDAMLAAAKENYIQSEVAKLVEDGVHEAVARELVEGRLAREKPREEEPPAPPEPPKPDRAQVELDELYALRPELRNKALPDEVVGEFAKGTRLASAYQSYLDKQQAAEKARLEKENRVLKQNAAAAAKAPVKGTKGGGATTAPQSAFDQAFLKGFDSDNW